MNLDSVPILLPKSAIPLKHSGQWQPTKHLKPPEPPAQDDNRVLEMEAAATKQGLDGKPFKRVRPRRTVDYMGGMGRWALLNKIRPSPRFVPYMRPAPPYIIDLLPPKAYPSNFSTSLCTKFVHTSTNKVRCPVNVVVWTPEGRRILTASTSGEFTLWNGLTFNFETILQAHDSAIRAVQFSHSGAYIASADQTGVIKYFQPNMNNLKAWNAHREAIRGLSFSPDDVRFVTASDDSTLRLWNFEESREERVFTGHNWDVKCVEWHPVKGLLVSGSKDNLVKFWDPRTGTCLSTLHQHKNTIQALAWSPTGEFVASASRDQSVRVFDIRAMKEFRIYKGHKKEACSLAWHPIHPLLVSGGSEGDILHWDLTAPEETPNNSNAIPPGPRATLAEAHDGNVWSLAFHPLGHLLVSASNDHTTRFWSRERPGDASSVFSGGGVKPPTTFDISGQEEEEDANVPGFGEQGPDGWNGQGGYSNVNGYGPSRGTSGGGWHPGDYQSQAASYNASFEPGSSGVGLDGGEMDDGIPGFAGGMETGYEQDHANYGASMDDQGSGYGRRGRWGDRQGRRY